jgi:hypothetical protein
MRVEMIDGKAAVDTIEDISGRGNNLILYGANGTDSSGVSYSPELRQWGIALDGSTGDSAIIPIALDSTDVITVAFDVLPRVIASGEAVIFATRLDTTGAGADSYGLVLRQRGDSLGIVVQTPATVYSASGRKAGLLQLGITKSIIVTRTATKIVCYVNGDSVLGHTITGSGNMRRANKLRIEQYSFVSYGTARAMVISNFRVYHRALSQKEIFRLVAESTDHNARRRFSRY